MYDLKEVFKALPHVQTIWVTKDGNFHLHPNNGGERIDRDAKETSKPEFIAPIEAKVEAEQVIDKQPEKLQTGRKAYKRRK